jgi:NADH-quinone oxidoreductase E subunit
MTHPQGPNIEPVTVESEEVTLSPETLRWIEERRSLYEEPRAALLPVLHRVQEELGHISLAAERAVAEAMSLPPSKVREVVSFYTLLRTQPQGRVRVDVCQTMSCMLRGARDLLRHIREKYGVSPGETSADGKFTLHAAECLCNCENAPVAQIGDEYFGPLTPEAFDRIIADISPDQQRGVTPALESTIPLEQRR